MLKLKELHLQSGVEMKNPLLSESHMVINGLVCGEKALSDTEGYQALEAWLGVKDALFITRPYADPIVCLSWQTWTELVSDKRPN